MTRQTCPAYELTDDSYIYHHSALGYEVRHVAKALTVHDRTQIIYGDGRRDEFDANGIVALATGEETAAYRREQDRFAVARALLRLGSKIVDRGLPVPAGGVGIVVSFDLADDSDLEPWSQWLSKRPQRGTSRPHIQAEAEGVEVYVYGPGTSGEFGPDLADAPSVSDDLADAAREITMAEVFSYGPVLDPPASTAGRIEVVAPDVEHRDSVGAFPVVAPATWCARISCPKTRTTPGSAHPRTESCPRTDEEDAALEDGYDGPVFEDPRPRAEEVYEVAQSLNDAVRVLAQAAERDGWSLSDGHRPPVDDEAMKHDRHSGEG